MFTGILKTSNDFQSMSSRPTSGVRSGSGLVSRISAMILLMLCGQVLAQGTNPGADATEATTKSTFWIHDPYAQTSVKAQTGEPDTTLWNAQRIKDYQDGLMVNADPPIGVLTISDINVQMPIYDGSEDLNLDRGVGRIKGTTWLGQEGNLGIAGHRDGVFRGLKDIQHGARIQVLSVYGVDTYEVSGIKIVEIDDVSVLHPTTEKMLTLVTCYPFYFVGHAPKRYIVHASAVE